MIQVTTRRWLDTLHRTEVVIEKINLCAWYFSDRISSEVLLFAPFDENATMIFAHEKKKKKNRTKGRNVNRKRIWFYLCTLYCTCTLCVVSVWRHNENSEEFNVFAIIRNMQHAAHRLNTETSTWKEEKNIFHVRVVRNISPSSRLAHLSACANETDMWMRRFDFRLFDASSKRFSRVDKPLPTIKPCTLSMHSTGVVL